MSITQAIKEYAHQLGFSLVGVASAGQLPHEEVFKTWLDEGRYGEMHYLDTPRSRELRARPHQLMPGCRSVLVLGVHYPLSMPLEPGTLGDQALAGAIASYAWGEDYHLTLPRQLRALVAFIQAQVGHPVPNRYCTDTAPILERELAQRAGFGWIGKNTCLINPRGGSYFLLAEILLGIDLEPDQPFMEDRCGKCTRCIDLCPTHCILSNRTLDARRCISYLTIEHKGSIPPDLRQLVGAWVFGCDICQQVCPWNRFSPGQADPAFAPQTTPGSIDLLGEIALDPSDFSQRYRRSPLKRAKHNGYLRNVIVALGNSRSHYAVPALARLLFSHPDALLRAHAAWALGQIGGGLAEEALQKALAGEDDPMVVSALQSTLEPGSL